MDAAAAVALAALGIGTAYVTDPSVATDYADPNAGLVALILLACLPLAARRRWPFTVFVVAGAATTVAGAMGWNAEFPGFASFVALYTVAAWRPLSVVIAGLGLFYAVEAAQWLTNVATRDPVDVLGVLVPVALGLILRRWRHERDAAHARALEAERTRAVAAERAVFAERLRIAGELHDVVTHTLSAVAVQSAVARHQLGDRPGPAGPALVAVEEASRVALDDLRRMLGVLHEEAEGVDLRPSPGLAELDLLASAHRAAHGPVELTVDPAVRSAPDSVQMTRLPAGAGGADQRPQARARRARARGRDLRRRPGDRAGGRRRARRADDGRGHGLWPRRHARAGRALRRQRRRRPSPRGRLPGGSDAAYGGRMIKVVVVDDQDLVRAGFVALLGDAPGLEVVGEAGQGEEAVRLVRRDPARMWC